MVEAAPERFEELVSEAVDGLRPHLGRMMRTVDIGSLGDTRLSSSARQIDSSERLTPRSRRLVKPLRTTDTGAPVPRHRSRSATDLERGGPSLFAYRWIRLPLVPLWWETLFVLRIRKRIG